MISHRPDQKILLVPCLLVLTGCSGDPDAEHRASQPGRAGCDAWELALTDGRCQGAGLPLDMACAPGEIALPDGGCQPAGVPNEACAEGFLPDGRDGCSPVLPEQVCPSGQMAIPGDSACREVAPCGDGPWGELRVEDTTQFVDGSYAGPDSDGSRERPWTTVQSAIDAAAPGAIVALAAGRYEEDAVVSGKPVRLWGRCPERVQLVGTGREDGAAVLLGEEASGSEVRGVAVTGKRSGIVVSEARSVTVERVWIRETTGSGVEVSERATAAVRGALVEQVAGVGVLIEGAQASIESSVVRSTRRGGDDPSGTGIRVDDRARTGASAALILRGSLVELSDAGGVSIAAAEGTIDATVVRTSGTGGFGRGIAVVRDEDTRKPGTLLLTRSLIEESRGFGVLTWYSKATVEASVIRANQANADGKEGLGLGIVMSPDDGGEALALRASLVEQNCSSGLLVWGAAASLEASVVRATRPDGAGWWGRGIDVYADVDEGARSQFSMRGCLVEENRQAGVALWSSDGTIEASIVRGTDPDDGGDYGNGVSIGGDEAGRGTLAMRSSIIERNHHSGIYIAGADASIETSVVRTTEVQLNAKGFGDGVVVLDVGGSSVADFTATEIVDNARAGLLFVNSTGKLSAVRAAGNRFGVVLQGDAHPTLDESDRFDDNTEAATIVGGDLPVPDALPRVP